MGLCIQKSLGKKDIFQRNVGTSCYFDKYQGVCLQFTQTLPFNASRKAPVRIRSVRTRPWMRAHG